MELPVSDAWLIRKETNSSLRGSIKFLHPAKKKLVLETITLHLGRAILENVVWFAWKVWHKKTHSETVDIFPFKELQQSTFKIAKKNKNC